MTDEINRRNAESVFQQLKDMDAMVREHELKLNFMAQALAEIGIDVNKLKQDATERRIKAMGTGPTESGNG